MLPMLTNRAEHSSDSSAKLPVASVSGLSEQNRNDYAHYRDVHMDTARPMESYADVHMATAKGYTLTNDITMDTIRGGTTLRQGGLKTWEKKLLKSSEVRRKATVAQLCEF